MRKSKSGILADIQNGEVRALSRAITIVENELDGDKELLLNVCVNESIPVLGITGPPGSGKSTLVNAILKELTQNQNNHIAVLAVDPSSPFTHGAILGDRLRMSDFFNHSKVYIRSLASRGMLGGLTSSVIEITDILKTFPFSHIIIETVGIGQSEMDIVRLADTTMLVLVPESGDEIQLLKAGVVEAADIFVINKSDRKGADLMEKNIKATLLNKHKEDAINQMVMKTIATTGEGVRELLQKVETNFIDQQDIYKKVGIYAYKAFSLITKKRMKGISITTLEKNIIEEIKQNRFHLYKFVAQQ